MKPNRRDKLERGLRASEHTLRSELLAALPRVAQTGEPVFLNSTNLPEAWRPHWVSPNADRLYRLAVECVQLRRQASLAVAGSIGQLFLAACRELVNTEDDHRRGPRNLARWLLEELRQSQDSAE